MNNEIKEILLIIKSCKQDYDKQKNGMHTFDYGELYLLYDYITNLQQENEDNLKCINSLKEQLESVINENQRLLKQWFENNDKAVKLISEKECYKENFNDYKSRCEKAIEYINNFNVDKSFSFPLMKRWEENQVKSSIDYEFNDTLKKDLLNILQNGSEDNE